MSTEPVLPSLDNLRVATMTDLPRIATVAAAGFFWSPSFQFQRPYYEDFPEDTLSSYWNEYKDMIADPAIVVLVAEDAVVPGESGGVYAALRRSPLYTPETLPHVRVVVGVCSIHLKPGSSLLGPFQTDQNESHVESFEVRARLVNSSRDQSAEAIKLYGEATAPAKKRYLAGQMRLGTLAVHPAYWRRGHATRLVSCCTRLADMEGTAIGVSATPMGATLAAKAGFEEQEIVRVKASDIDASPSSDAVLWIGVRPPQSPRTKSPSDTSSSSPDSPIPEMRGL